MGRRSNRKKSQAVTGTKKGIRAKPKPIRLTPHKRELLKKITYLEGLNNSLLEQIPISVLIVDGSLKVTFANRNFYLKTRKNPLDVVRRYIGEIFPGSFVGSSKLVSKVEEVIEGGQIQEDEIRWKGTYITVKYFHWGVN